MTREPRARVASLLASVSEETSELASKLRSADFDQLVEPVEAASKMRLNRPGLDWCLAAFAENRPGFEACIEDVLSRSDVRSPLRLLCTKVRAGDHRIPAQGHTEQPPAAAPEARPVDECVKCQAVRPIDSETLTCDACSGRKAELRVLPGGMVAA